jgi:DNA-directed RNA polymerase subunit RPC12/RpoP
MMKCVHCKRELAFSTRSDRTSGQSVDIYRCVYCGIEFKEYRPNRQSVR